MPLDDTSALFVGTYAPPFCGIASQLISPMSGLEAGGMDDLAVPAFSDEGGIARGQRLWLTVETISQECLRHDASSQA